MANETVTVTQTLDQVTVTSSGATGLVGGGTIEGDLNVGVDGTGHDVKFFGDTAGKYMQWDQSADKLFINGELEVNGSATTFNSTVITIDDPIFTLGGQQRTDALDDSKDRGIEFFYHDGAQKTGFMGYDDSADAFTFLTSATNSNEVFSGTEATIHAGTVKTPTIGTQSGNLAINPAGGGVTIDGDLSIDGTHRIKLGTGISGLQRRSDANLELVVSDNTGQINLVTIGSAGGKAVNFRTHTSSAASATTVASVDESGNLSVTGEISSDGDVGIGTSSPSFTSGGGLQISHATQANVRLSDSSDASYNTDVAMSGEDFYLINRSSTGDLKFRVNSSTEAITVLSNGKVGIGTTSPAYRLSVDGGDIGVPNGNKFYVGGAIGDTVIGSLGSSSGDLALISDGGRDVVIGSGDVSDAVFVKGTDGNVGIGTTTPQEQLHLYGASAAKMEIESAGGGDASLKFQVAAQSWSAGIDNGDGDKFKINTGSNPGSADMLAIDSSGNVGIGTTAPAKTLDVDGDVRVLDGHKFFCGDGDDLEIYHNATNSFITNKVGDLTISNEGDDKDIIFQSDDGSGGVETYFFLDGSVSSGNPFTVFPDNSLLAFGSGRDFILNHNGSNTNLGNYTGDIEIVNYANDKDIIFKTDDGSGGTAEYFRLDGSAAGSGNLFTIFPDSSYIGLGSNGTGDFIMAHNGTNTTFSNYTGNLQFTNNSDDGDIIFRCDDGSGGVETYFFLDGSANGGANPITIFPDNSILALGDSTDLMLWHNATNSYLQNFVGDLHIENYADDKDIFFRSDNGSGGLETYFFLDGSTGYTQFPDNKRLTLGSSDDFQIFHDALDSTIQNSTGNIYVTNFADDKDIIFQSDDGSGGVTPYFTLDGSVGYSVAPKHVRFEDDIEAIFGADSDAKIRHSGSSLQMECNTGNWSLRQNATNADIRFYSDDGTGSATTEYFRVDGGTEEVYFSQPTRFADSKPLRIGDASDLQIQHNGTNSIFENVTGDLTFANYADDKDIVFRCDDGSGGVETYFFLDGSASSGNPLTQFPDLSQLAFGNSQDLLIRHDGADSIIQNNGGDFIINQHTNDKDLIFQCDDGIGGVTPYLTLDGSTEQVVFSKALNYSTTLVNDSNYTTTRSDSVILFHSMSTYRYLTLASADCVAGRKIHVKNRDNSEYIYIQTEGSENIDGSSSIIGTQTARGSITLIADGSNWFILNKYST